MRNRFFVLFGYLMAGLTYWGPAVAETRATVVWYTQQEPGIDPYRVRYIITPDFMRSDDGQDSGDFLLFDRGQRQIYSVATEDRRVLEIDGNADAPQKPAKLLIDIRQHTDRKAPPINGKSPLEVDLVAAEKICRSALVAPGFLEPARQAMQEYSQALAVQQLRTLSNTPADYQTPCFLSRFLYATDFHLALGMVLADWNDQGERRELSAYETDVPVSGALFVLPDGFTRYQAGVH